MQTIAVANQKGGVGKTTTATGLAGALRLAGKRVLLVDCDPQCNSTDTYHAQTTDVATLYDLLTQQGSASEAIQHTPDGDVLPGDPLLRNADTVLIAMGKEYRLKEGLQEVTGCYDYVILDTPPQLGVLLVNALAAADSIIVPVTADRYALQGLTQLAHTVADVRKYVNPRLVVRGLLLTQYRQREKLAQAVVESLPDLAAAMGTTVLPVQIHAAMGVRTAQADGHSIFSGDTARSVAADDYKALADLIMGV